MKSAQFFPLLFGRTGQRGLTSDTFRLNCTLALDMTEHDEVVDKLGFYDLMST